MSKRTKVAGGVCGAVLLALLSWEFFYTIVWDGQFDLPITVVDGGRSVDHRRIATVDYTCFFPQPANAASIAESLALKDARRDGEDYIAHIPCSGTRSGLGFRNTYGQLRSVFIRLELTDGRAISVLCPVSDS